MDLTNGAQLHIALNHIAVIGVPLAALVLAGGLLRRSADVTVAGLALLALTAIGVAPAYFTGEGAEEVVEAYGVDDGVIHEHEEFAEKVAVATGLLGLLAIGALVAFRRTGGRALPTVALGAALLAAGALAWTAHLGGEIRHPEIRPASERGAAPTGETHDDRDRDRGHDDD